MSTRDQRTQIQWITKTTCCIAAVLVIITSAGSAQSQESKGPSIVVQVLDEQGGVILGAQATLRDPSGRERSESTNGEGKVVFSDLLTGTYGIRISAQHFRTYEDRRIQVAVGRDVNLNVTLRIAGVEETISVFPDTSIAQVAEYVGGSLIIRGDALMALEGPGGLEALLRALAVRTSGPFGPVALVNGFEDVALPPSYSIREVRINDNPFSAEYSTLGLGRIEILTKPGTEKLRVATFGSFGDANFNSRNPFAPEKVGYNSRMFGGNIGGPLWAKRATFFIDFNRQQVDTNAVINATVVDSTFSIFPLRQAIVVPQLRKAFSPRLDYQMGANHTWVLRYGDTRSHDVNSGVGEFSLQSRSQDSNGRIQTVQLTETAVLNSKAVNETRVQYVRSRMSRNGDNLTPTINVAGAFIGGGAEIGAAYNRHNLTELQNVISFQGEKHIVKAGLQWRHTQQVDGSSQNFGGTYTFASKIAPQLDSANQAIRDAAGNPVVIPITTIEAYRRTLLFTQQGLSPEAVRQLGGGASQFSITTGDPQTGLRQYQAGVFLQDNWRLHPNFTLSGGIRFEQQSDVSDNSDFAPRLAFAWGIGGGNTSSRTVVRGGIGAFYNRLGENVVLRARQMDGIHQRQYLISDTSILDLFPAVPTASLLVSSAAPQSTVRLASDLRAPSTVHSSLSIERQLFQGLTVAATASNLRTVHLLRSRNINAPLPGTYDPAFPQKAVRPFGTPAEIFQYESSGVFDQQQLLLNIVYRAGKNATLWSTYTFSNSKTDTDSPDTFPANSYDLRSEYSWSSLQSRHTFYWGGWIRIKGGIEVIPLVLWRSRLPFDIITGRDANGDSLFTDRPAFATDLNRPSVVMTPFGNFDVSPLPGQQIIPRNYGTSPNFFIANLRVGKRIPLRKQAALTVSIQGTNIFNHSNRGTPVGNLGSPLFGKSNVAAGDWGLGSNQAGNRRLEMIVYFNF